MKLRETASIINKSNNTNKSIKTQHLTNSKWVKYTIDITTYYR
jgi:hypothetical protein